MALRASVLGAFSALLLSSAATAQDRPVVATASGPVRGVASGDLVAFKGIPFAAPPVGALRWKPPVAPAPWKDSLDASRFGAICTQPARPDGVLAAGAGGKQSEDCLYLNVW